MLNRHIKQMQMSALVREGWPTIDSEKGTCKTVGDFVRHLRNAVAHSRITYSSDSRYLNEVNVTIEDRKNKNSPPHWRAVINAGDLRVFSLKLVELVEQMSE
jgi:hypothetical protein